jgi:hypothetical protein
MSREITNVEDIIDSRDVIARIAYLEGTDDEDEKHELKVLEELVEQCEYCSDWGYGEALIRGEYFTEYAEQLAEDIGAIDRTAQWPLNHIDWEAAAEALKQDYAEVEFDGATYYIRY